MTRTTNRTAATATRGRQSGDSAKVLPADVRALHRSLLLRELYKKEPASRADLSRATGLTRVTVSDVVADLLDRDLVEEVGQRSGTRVGKPAMLVSVKYDAYCIVCLDVSDDSEFRGAVLSLGGEVLTRHSLKFDGSKGEDALEILLELARELITQANHPILGIGVGTPGVVDAHGVVRNAPNLGWRGLDLAGALASALQLPAYVANDADTAVLAENTFGEGDGSGLMLVQISHGVGAGIMCDGILLRGPGGTAGEIGHVRVSDQPVSCPCGRTGCLEAFLAAPRLRGRVEGLDSTQTGAELSRAGEQLGTVLAPIVQALGLHDVVLTGPRDLLEGEFLNAAAETVNSTTSHFSDKPVVLRMSALGSDGVLTGAAAHVLSGELGL